MLRTVAQNSRRTIYRNGEVPARRYPDPQEPKDVRANGFVVNHASVALNSKVRKIMRVALPSPLRLRHIFPREPPKSRLSRCYRSGRENGCQ